ncbi:MAG: gamma-glutamyl-phosphate reductase, partial [Providencia alcalifaciens]|nr:gamma-glutamyl-phosphate reductase [Providencia alcalifaciens]
MLEQMGKAAREASWQLAQFNTKQKNSALEQIADLLEQKSASILAANQLDMAQAQQSGM